MEVIDKYGNEYIVTEFSNSITLPVRLKSIKILRSINVSPGDVNFTTVGQIFWIYKSKKCARHNNFYEEDIITVKSLKLKGE